MTFFAATPLAYLPFVGFLALGYLGLHRMRSTAAGWLIVAAIVLAVWVALFDRALALTAAGRPVLLSRYTGTMWNTALIAVVAGVILLLNSPAPPIVYKNF